MSAVNHSKLVISGDNKSALAAISGVGKGLDRAQGDIKRFSSGIGGALGSVKSLLTNIPFMMSAAFGSLVINGARKMREFEAEMRNVNTIIGVSDVALGNMGNSLKSMSSAYGMSATDLAKALYQVTSAGIETSEAIDFIKASSEASIAGLSSVTEAVDVITTVLNSYQLKAEDATTISDILFQTVKLGKTTFSELAASLSNVAPLAASAGVDFKEVAAAIASLTKQGIPTAQAMTQLRAAITSVNKVLGDGWARTMTLQDAFIKVADQAGNSQTKLLKMMGRIEGVNAVLAMTGGNAKIASSDLASMGGAFGSTAAAMGEQSNTLDFKMRQLNASVDQLSMSFAQFSVAPMTTAVGQLNELLYALNNGKFFKYMTFQDIGYENLMVANKSLREIISSEGEMGNDLYEIDSALGQTKERWTNIIDPARRAAMAAANMAMNSEAAKKAAEDLARQWTTMQQSLASDIAKTTLNDFEYQVYKIDQRVKALHEKFGDKKIIDEWADAMKLDAAKKTMSELSFKFYQVTHSVEKLHAMFGDIKIIDEWAAAMRFALSDGPMMPLEQIKPPSTKDLLPPPPTQFDMTAFNEMHEQQRAQIAATTNMELGFFALRESAQAGMFANMSNAMMGFYEASGRQNQLAFGMYKAFSIAETGIATYEMAAKAYNSMVGIPIVGPALAVAAAAAATAYGLSRVQAISAMSPGAGATGGMPPSAPTIRSPINNYNNSSNTANTTSVTVNVYGNVIDMDQLGRDIIPAIEKAVGDGVGNIVFNNG